MNQAIAIHSTRKMRRFCHDTAYGGKIIIIFMCNVHCTGHVLNDFFFKKITGYSYWTNVG